MPLEIMITDYHRTQSSYFNIWGAELSISHKKRTV